MKTIANDHLLSSLQKFIYGFDKRSTNNKQHCKLSAFEAENYVLLTHMLRLLFVLCRNRLFWMLLNYPYTTTNRISLRVSHWTEKKCVPISITKPLKPCHTMVVHVWSLGQFKMCHNDRYSQNQIDVLDMKMNTFRRHSNCSANNVRAAERKTTLHCWLEKISKRK